MGAMVYHLTIYHAGQARGRLRVVVKTKYLVWKRAAEKVE